MLFNKNLSIKELKLKANECRMDLLKTLVEAKSGHTAGPMGLADIFVAMYFKVLRHDPKNPLWEKRDRFCLSCGHVVPIKYVVMAHIGYFPKKQLKTLRKINSLLQGHPSYVDIPALEHSSGPLGQGTSVSVGKAIAAKLNGQKHYVYCIVSDGEQQEGQTWEAAMFAGNQKLDNLIWIMDRNNIQIDGYTEEVMPLEPLKTKYESFGWHVFEIDGNNMQEIIDACQLAKNIHEKPTLIIAHTTPGKGVSFMENNYEWHGKPPTLEEYKLAIKELKKRREEIKKEKI